jgi:hypothetical protein
VLVEAGEVCVAWSPAGGVVKAGQRIKGWFVMIMSRPGPLGGLSFRFEPGGPDRPPVFPDAVG